MNLSKRAGLLGMLGVFVGMRVRLTKKVLPPELVQEATGEVVGIGCHPKERFGNPGSSHLRPGDAHECWQRGWVKCDYLPLHIEVRWDGCEQDYTGTGRPGLWFLEPFTDTWKLPVATLLTVDHPNAARAKKVKATTRKQKTVDVTSTQVPLAPELVVTFQNIQGQTVRGPEGQPKGFVLDMFRPQTMRGRSASLNIFSTSTCPWVGPVSWMGCCSGISRAMQRAIWTGRSSRQGRPTSCWSSWRLWRS